MTRYYCDYCDIYLTHDSLKVRRAHDKGAKHVNSVEDHYSREFKKKSQEVVDYMVALYESNYELFSLE